jgi:hypothetical protein
MEVCENIKQNGARGHREETLEERLRNANDGRKEKGRDQVYKRENWETSAGICALSGP